MNYDMKRSGVYIQNLRIQNGYTQNELAKARTVLLSQDFYSTYLQILAYGDTFDGMGDGMPEIEHAAHTAVVQVIGNNGIFNIHRLFD